MSPGVGDCVVWWDAWAVVVTAIGLAVAVGAGLIAFFGVLGSWAAAVATYLAVIEPLRRRKLEDHATAAVAMENFAGELIDLRFRLGSVGFVLPMLQLDMEPARAKMMVRGFARYRAVVPELAPTPETRDLVVSLNGLRRALRTWVEVVEAFDMTPDPETGDEIAEYLVEELNLTFMRLMDQIRQVAGLIKPLVPQYTETLDQVLANHNGFLALKV